LAAHTGSILLTLARCGALGWWAKVSMTVAQLI
jgi:hypothetical protein